MPNVWFREVLKSGRVRLEWVSSPTKVTRLRTWHLRMRDAGGRGVEIDTGLTTVEGDRYGELTGRAVVKAAACMLAVYGVEVVLPSGQVFETGWAEESVREVGSGE